MAPQSVLVTGSSGFIGLRVARALAKMGHRVIGLDPAPPGHEIPGVISVREKLGDVRQMSELLCSRKIDTVVHAGGISGPMLARDDPYLICEANVIGAINLIEAARLVAIRRFVYCSSAAVFRNTLPAPVPDDAPLIPKILDNDPWRSGRRPAGKEGSRGRCGTSSRLSDALRRFACPTGTAASQGFRAASRMASDAPHRHATRSWPKALGNRLYESLSRTFGISRSLKFCLSFRPATHATRNDTGMAHIRAPPPSPYSMSRAA